jgi:hypothetical protein
LEELGGAAAKGQAARWTLPRTAGPYTTEIGEQERLSWTARDVARKEVIATKANHR